MGNAQSNTSPRTRLERHCRLAQAHIAQRPDSIVTLPAGLVVRVLSPEREDLSVTFDDGDGSTEFRFVPKNICNELLEANDQPMPETISYRTRTYLAPIGNTPHSLNGGLGWERVRVVHHNFKGVMHRRSALGNALPPVAQKVESAYIRQVDEDGEVQIVIDDSRGRLWGHWRFGTHTQADGTESDQWRAARLGFGSPEEVGWMYHQGVADDDQDEITKQLERIKVVWVPGHLNGTMGVGYGKPRTFREHFAEINRRRWELHQQGHVPRSEYPVYTGTDERWAMRPGADASHLHDHRTFHAYEGRTPVQSEADLLAFRPEWRGRSLTADPAVTHNSRFAPRPPSATFFEFADSRVEVGGPWQVLLRQNNGQPASHRSFTPGSYHTDHCGSDAYMHKINYQYESALADEAPMTWDESPVKLDQDGNRMRSVIGDEVVYLRDFVGIPDIIDPNEWPADLIAWRRIWPSLSWEQIIARLPPSVRTQASTKELSNRMQMRCRRAYDKLNMKSWKSSGGRQIKALADRHIEPHLTDWHRANNTTLGLTPGSVSQNGERIPFPSRNQPQNSRCTASVPPAATAPPPSTKTVKRKRSGPGVASTNKRTRTETDPARQDGGGSVGGSSGGQVMLDAVGQETPDDQTSSGGMGAADTPMFEQDSAIMTPYESDMEFHTRQDQEVQGIGGQFGFDGQRSVNDHGVHDNFIEQADPFSHGLESQRTFQNADLGHDNMDWHRPTEYDLPQAFPEYPTGSWQREEPEDALVPMNAGVATIDPRLLQTIGGGDQESQLQAPQQNGGTQQDVEESDFEEFFDRYCSER